MTDIRASGFDSPAQLREHLAEIEEESPAEDSRAGDDNFSATRQIAALRHDVADLRDRLATIRKRTDGLNEFPYGGQLQPWLRIVATIAATYMLGRFVVVRPAPPRSR